MEFLGFCELDRGSNFLNKAAVLNTEIHVQEENGIKWKGPREATADFSGAIGPTVRIWSIMLSLAPNQDVMQHKTGHKIGRKLIAQFLKWVTVLQNGFFATDADHQGRNWIWLQFC